SSSDPDLFKILAEVVQASSPALPRPERLIQNPLLLMGFILRCVYSEDQRCHAVDIFESVDKMYACIPKADATAQGADADLWVGFQREADELEKHLTCVELLQKHKIKLSLSFADLRRGCSNENLAVHCMWNLFRVLGTRYRPAVFWRGFQQELFYLHSHAFAAVPLSSVYDMYVRCLVEQEHFEVMSVVVENWTLTCGDM
ncbi:nbas, partial [Symbiodinium sp. CCMP2456]